MVAMMIELGRNYALSDRSIQGDRARGFGVSGWGVPAWGRARARMGFAGPRKPLPIAARYFCADCNSLKTNQPVAQGNKYGATKTEYQAAVTAHYTDNHPDLHYPVDQAMLDAKKLKAKVRARKIARNRENDLHELIHKFLKHGTLEVKGGQELTTGALDISGSQLPVRRPRELADLTDFDFPDANVADAGAEEIELDQLVSIQARIGRRLLGVELQNISGSEMVSEFLSVAGADHEMSARLSLATRTGDFSLDDAELIWRLGVSVVSAFQGTGEGENVMPFSDHKFPPPGGTVYVAIRLFWRFLNNLDRQVDTGDLFTAIATIDQRLSTFLLFEMLEERSGIFAFT